MHCKSCGASIIWVNSEKCRKMPLDLRPISVWQRNNDGTITHVRGHQSHFGTCPNAEAHRKKKKLKNHNTVKNQDDLEIVADMFGISVEKLSKALENAKS